MADTYERTEDRRRVLPLHPRIDQAAAMVRFSCVVPMTKAHRLRSRVRRKHALSEVEGSHARFWNGAGAGDRSTDRNLARVCFFTFTQPFPVLF
jgi:hypothetical protein